MLIRRSSSAVGVRRPIFRRRSRVLPNPGLESSRFQSSAPEQKSPCSAALSDSEPDDCALYHLEPTRHINFSTCRAPGHRSTANVVGCPDSFQVSVQSVADDDRSPADELGAALIALAPAGVRVGVRLIDPADAAGLFAHEWASVRHAVATRRAEFASGRALLRDLLGSDVAIPVSPGGGAPLLPTGQVASLAHDREFVLAAVAASAGIASIGIDVEPFAILDPDEAGEIVRPDDAPVDPIALFVMKEATYKAWSSLGGHLLNLHDVRIRVDGGAFTAEIIDAGQRFAGRFATAAERQLALVIVARGAPSMRTGMGKVKA